MLEDCLLDSRSSSRSRKPATLILSILVHGSLGLALIAIPLFQIPSLPLVAAVVPLPPPPVGFRSVELVPVRGGGAPSTNSPVAPAAKPLVAPEVMPTMIANVQNTDPAIFIGLPAIPGAGPGGPGGAIGDPNGSPGGRGAAPPPPPPSPPPAPPLPPPPPAINGPVRVATIDPSRLLHTVQPVYPRLAALARVEGSVVLEAVITRDGLVDPKRLKVISGHNMLWPAAVEAVEQWRYKPTVLNGERVEVLANITVNFSLSR